MKFKNFVALALTLAMTVSNVSFPWAGEILPDNVEMTENNSALEYVDDVPVQTMATYDTTYAVEGGNIYFNSSTGAITDADTSITSANIPSEINGVQ